MKLIFTLFSLFIASHAVACSCVKHSTVAESSKWAKHVFVGKINFARTVVENKFKRKYFDLEVVEIIKGAPTNGYFIKPGVEIFTNCYPQEISVGDLYVFFVKDNIETTLNYCSNTKNFEYLEHSDPKWRNSVE